VTYIDSSVALAYVLAEARMPSRTFWDSNLVSSRLLIYEVWNRLQKVPLTYAMQNAAGALLAGIELIEMSEIVLARALEPWPTPIRTLDALHLATIEYLHRQGATVEMASYDSRLLAAAQALGVPIAPL
jgi:predicted nucleic acid-binding protein